MISLLMMAMVGWNPIQVATFGIANRFRRAMGSGSVTRVNNFAWYDSGYLMLHSIITNNHSNNYNNII